MVASHMPLCADAAASSADRGQRTFGLSLDPSDRPYTGTYDAGAAYVGSFQTYCDTFWRRARNAPRRRCGV